jgi:anti-sigma factor RsiW
MKCHAAARQLSDYHDGHLPAAARERLEAHLAGCPSCRREHESLRETLRLVSELGRIRCPVDCRDTVLARLGPVRPAPARPALGLFGELRRRLAAMAAASALAAACATGVLFWVGREAPTQLGTPPVHRAVNPAEWHDANRTQQALSTNDSLILAVPDP